MICFQVGHYTTPDWLSPGSKMLISQLLQVDPKKRIPMSALLDHPWLTENFNSPIEWESKYTVGIQSMTYLAGKRPSFSSQEVDNTVYS